MPEEPAQYSDNTASRNEDNAFEKKNAQRKDMETFLATKQSSL